MRVPAPDDVTRLLHDLSDGRKEAVNDLLTVVYDELRVMAGRYLRGERPDHTLQATALVNEAYLRLVDRKTASWASRAEFYKLAATVMRRILVDHARKHRAKKRGGGARKMRLEPDMVASSEEDLDLVALDEALNKLAEVDPRKSRVVELRYFVGLNMDETARTLGSSLRTVEREWTMARAWLFREIQGGVKN